MKPENFTILTVDDTPANIQLLTHYLEKQGYRVISAEDGFEGFKAAIQYQPDLVLLDVMMPGTDGYEVCELLKAEESTRNIPVMFLTAKADMEDRGRGFEMGAADYITKPFHLKEIATRINTQVTLKILREQNQRLNRSLSLARPLMEKCLVSESVLCWVKAWAMSVHERVARPGSPEETGSSGGVDPAGLAGDLEGLEYLLGQVLSWANPVKSDGGSVDLLGSMENIAAFFQDQMSGVSLNIETSADVPRIPGDAGKLECALLILASRLTHVTGGKSLDVIFSTDSPPPEAEKAGKKGDHLCLSFKGSGDASSLEAALNGENLRIRIEKEESDFSLMAAMESIRNHSGILLWKKRNDDKRTGFSLNLYFPLEEGPA
jgi:CheY-like chemotaxis protein